MKNYLFLRREDDFQIATHGGNKNFRSFTLWLNRIQIGTFREGSPGDQYYVDDHWLKQIAGRVVLFERACNTEVEHIEDVTIKLPGTKYGVTDLQLAILAERAKVK